MIEGASEAGIIAYGTTHWAIEESLDQMRNEFKLKADYLRVRAYPFTREVIEFIEKHKRIYIVEQNRDAQLASLLKMELPAEQAAKLRSVLHYNGLPIDARSVTVAISSKEGK